MNKKFWALGLALVVLLSCTACGAQRKPEDNTGRMNTPAPNVQAPERKPLPAAPTEQAPTRPLPTAPNEANALARSLAAKGEAVPGVDSCTVVITGSTAMVGIDTDESLETGKTENVKEDVARTIKRADNRIKNVLVSTDPDTVTRIRKIAQGIGEGKPITTFNKEVETLLRGLTPTTR